MFLMSLCAICFSHLFSVFLCLCGEISVPSVSVGCAFSQPTEGYNKCHRVKGVGWVKRSEPIGTMPCWVCFASPNLQNLPKGFRWLRLHNFPPSWLRGSGFLPCRNSYLRRRHPLLDMPRLKTQYFSLLFLKFSNLLLYRIDFFGILWGIFDKILVSLCRLLKPFQLL